MRLSTFRTWNWQASAVVLLPFLLYSLHAWVFRGWIVDDAGISFAYARNLAQGYGLVSQPGRVPVEGFTNFAWVVLLAPFFSLRLFDPIITPKLISGALVLLSFILVYRALATSSRPYALLAFVGLCLLALNSSFVIWTTSGLENPLYVALICALFFWTVRFFDQDETARLPVAAWLGSLAALVAMTRPDGVLFALVVPACLLLSLILRRSRPAGIVVRQGAAYLVAFGLIYGGFLVFRRLYFGDWLPNTYYAKGGPSLQSVWSVLLLRGEALSKTQDLMSSVAGGAGLAVLTLAGGATVYLIGARRFGRTQAILLMLAAASAAVYILLPSDWMGEFRFATPFLVFACLYLVSVAQAVIDRLAVRPSLRAGVSVAGAAIALGASAFLFYPRTAQFASNPTVSFSTVADAYGLKFNAYAARLGLSDGSLLLPDVGGTLYYSQLKVYDLGGLTDSTVARTMGRNQQAFYDYIFETLKPTFISTHGAWDLIAYLDHDHRFRRDYVAIDEFPDDWVKQTIGETRYSGDYVRREAVHEAVRTLFNLRLENGQTNASYTDLLMEMGYQVPAAPTGDAVGLLTPVSYDIGGVTQVLGYSLSADTLRPGDTLTGTVYWSPRANTDQPYTVFVHLYDPAVGSLAQSDTYPLKGKYATTVWVPGRPFLDSYTLKLPDTTPAASGATVVLGLYDAPTMQRLPVTDEQTGLASANSWAEVGQVRVLP